MQKLKLCAAVSMATLMLSQSALADRVKGSAKADFSNDELEVPCVLIEGTGGNGDGRFYDIVLERRGKSFNYEMIFAEREDGDMCAEMANYARFIDDDQEDEDDSDDDESMMILMMLPIYLLPVKCVINRESRFAPRSR